MSVPRILVQLDPDDHASVFDAVVAIDSDVDHLLQYASVEPVQVRDLVYGAMFTRGVTDLKSTAVFVGGADVSAGEAILKQVQDAFFGPMRVSVMLDANGANTTAAAAVVAAARHLDLAEITATVLAGTGSVGRRVIQLLSEMGARVRVASRSHDRAATVCHEIQTLLNQKNVEAQLTPYQAGNSEETEVACQDVQLIIGAGAPGVELLSYDIWSKLSNSLRVAIDLNAVPPLGIAGTAVHDQAVSRDGILFYGAIGVGGTKMKIHREAIRRLFTANDLVLDASEIFAIARELEQSS